jgi:hypothetical protein
LLGQKRLRIGGGPENQSILLPRKITKILHLQPKQFIKMKEEESQHTIVKTMNKPHTEIATQQNYSFMNEKE